MDILLLQNHPAFPQAPQFALRNTSFTIPIKGFSSTRSFLSAMAKAPAKKYPSFPVISKK
jgi:hypothetical protein